MSFVVACSGPRRLALLGNCQCGCGTALKDGAPDIGIMGRLGLQWIAAGCSVWLGFSVRYIVGRRRK
jgi:hypothetical protein